MEIIVSDIDVSNVEIARIRQRRVLSIVLLGFGLVLCIFAAYGLSHQQIDAVDQFPEVRVVRDLPDAAREPMFIYQCETWGTDLGRHPIFNSQEELVSAGWGPYFMAMYGEIPTTRYPICVGSFWYLNQGVMSKLGMRGPGFKRCPGSAGDAYIENNVWQKPGDAWIWHPPPFGINGHGLPSDTWIEVTHHVSLRETVGSWFMFSAGSGIWLNTGKTIIFQDHPESYHSFCPTWPCKGRDYVTMSAEAARLGYTTVQFLRHPDVQWKCKMGVMNIEIVHVGLTGGGSCPGNANVFRTGWNADKPCQCDHRSQYLNCKGVGQVARKAIPKN